MVTVSPLKSNLFPLCAHSGETYRHKRSSELMFQMMTPKYTQLVSVIFATLTCVEGPVFWLIHTDVN